ncbi:hypothetical protein C1645_830060 [Glomus cerebriforme]|uniref:Uncharacterized protein n=1 Tax=Glomus cerebriforme TaxID=658196 RepID=A0A397SIT2_9GLOM|nr:hypothetical protein C1645_830060 [Glomus cerebriforme]
MCERVLLRITGSIVIWLTSLVEYLKKCNRNIENNLFIEAQLMSCLRYDIFKKKPKIDAIYTLFYYGDYLAAKIDGANAKLKGKVVEQWRDTKIKLKIQNREVAEQW